MYPVSRAMKLVSLSARAIHGNMSWNPVGGGIRKRLKTRIETALPCYTPAMNRAEAIARLRQHS
jgi:hypothetical protein